ncbi:MAG: hypothetical protein RSF90_02990, partial [Pygmaiobacter sp.]
FGIQLISTPMAILASPPGGFFVFGMMMAVAIMMDQKAGRKVHNDPEKMGCAGCISEKACNGEEGSCEA